MNRIFIWPLMILLSACATTPDFRLDDIDYGLTPAIASRSTGQSSGQKVLWGGIILSSTNFSDHTRLEILSYPVDEKGRIRTTAEPAGRFYALYPGYLETAEYGKGRHVSLTGKYIGLEPGKVGDADYTFPVVNVDQIHLWPVESANDGSPKVHFGIGVMFH